MTIPKSIDQVKWYGRGSDKGVESTLKVGMTTDAHIVADSKKILYFLLEKID